MREKYLAQKNKLYNKIMYIVSDPEYRVVEVSEYKVLEEMQLSVELWNGEQTLHIVLLAQGECYLNAFKCQMPTKLYDMLKEKVRQDADYTRNYQMETVLTFLDNF